MVNWFNDTKPNKEFNFLGIKRQKKMRSPFSLDLPKKSNFNFWGSSSTFKKESTKNKTLSKWGDADMDGTPNYFDCDPRNWLKDQKEGNITEAEFKQRSKGRGRPRRTLKELAQAIEEAIQAQALAYSSGGLEKKGKKPTFEQAQAGIILAKLKGKFPKAKYIKRVGETRAKQVITIRPKLKVEVPSKEKEKFEKLAPEEKKAYLQRLKEERLREIAAQRMAPYRKVREAVTEKVKVGVDIGKRGVRKLGEITTPEAIEKGAYAISAPLVKAGEVVGEVAAHPIETAEAIGASAAKAGMKFGETAAYIATLPLSEEGRAKMYEAAKRGYESTKAESAKVGKVVEKGVMKVQETLGRVEIHPGAIVQRGKAIAKAVPKAMRATYGKEERIATAKMKKLVKAGLKQTFGSAITQTRFGPAIRGRPRGPSGRYMIEGKPVYEEEYQQYAAQQRALNRITPSMAQQAPVAVAPEAMQAEEEQEQAYPSETSPITPEQVEEAKMIQMPQQTGPTSEEVSMAQEIAQQQDNILNAPNPFKGELKATGGSLLTSTGPQILDAPQFMKGHMRTLNRSAEVPAVVVGERPQTNPYGDEYIDIDLGTGKPKLKKRTREKWVTGEAI